MKKYIFMLLIIISANTFADSKNIGTLNTFIGTKVFISVNDNYGRKSVFMYTRGRHGIRRAAISMEKAEAVRLVKILNEAIAGIDK